MDTSERINRKRGPREQAVQINCSRREITHSERPITQDPQKADFAMKQSNSKTKKLTAPYLLVVIVTIVAILSLGGCDSSEHPQESTSSASATTQEAPTAIEQQNIPTVPVSITVVCESNLFFSKYDINVSVDGQLVGTLDHGTSQTFDLALAEGEHSLIVCEKGDTSVDGSASFDVNGSTMLKCKAHCTYSQVELNMIPTISTPLSSNDAISKQYEEVSTLFSEAGFTNVREEEVRDLTLDRESESTTVSSIAIGGMTDFNNGTLFFSDEEVVITYHSLSDEAKEQKEEIEKQESIITPEKNEDFRALLQQNSTNAEWFADAYEGETVEFDCYVGSIMNHGDYKTRYDVLLLAGDYGASPSLGPNFKLENISVIGLGLSNSYLSNGDNVRVTAIVENYDPNQDVLVLDPISMTNRS